MFRWEKHLQSMADLKRPLRMLDVGGYEGEITAWFLNNLASNPESHVYVIDTWKQSSELGIDYKQIHKTFQKAVKKTKREDQLSVLNIKRDDALYHLLDLLEQESIDVAFVDASQDPSNILYDLILIWKLIKKNGILILDDYTLATMDASRTILDTFIRNYQNEINILETNIQIVIQKKNIDDLSITEYASKYYIYKRITTLSDIIIKLPDRIAKRKTSRAIRTTLINTNLAFTTRPSYNAEDKLEEQFHELVPIYRERVFFNTILTAVAPTARKLISDYSVYKINHPLLYIPARIDRIIELATNDSDKHTFLTHYVEEPRIRDLIVEPDVLNVYKIISPNVKQLDHMYIKPSHNSKTYSDLPIETVESIVSLHFLSLKPHTYDKVDFGLIADATISFSDYKKLNYQGRDSISVRWNCIYVLIATYCLKKGGALSILFYGAKSKIVCEFISYVSSFFSHTPEFSTGYTVKITANSFKCRFDGFKGITSYEQQTLLNWFHSCKPGTFYRSLGVPCKSVIQNRLQQISNTYKQNIKLLYTIAKEYTQILDKCTLSEKEDLLKYIISLRINNYLNILDKYLK